MITALHAAHIHTTVEPWFLCRNRNSVL